MIPDLSRTDRQHLAIAREPAAISLVPKTCACGKRSPAKQLAQHGKCVACLFDARVATLQPGDAEKLAHTLGAVPERPKSKWGFRNYYCASNSGSSFNAMQRLVAAGFAEVGHIAGTQTYFHATKDGCKLVGLNAARTREALGGQP
jgi:hypothetical protein